MLIPLEQNKEMLDIFSTKFNIYFRYIILQATPRKLIKNNMTHLAFFVRNLTEIFSY